MNFKHLHLFLFACLSFFSSNLFAQATIEFRISAVSSTVGDMDFIGNSDPAWCYEMLDNTYGRFDESNVEYGGVNCIGTRNPNDVFFSEVYNCGAPASYRFRWRARENDAAFTGDVNSTGGDALTAIQTVNIPAASINLPQLGWSTLGTYSTSVGGTTCSGGSVTWTITLQYQTAFTSWPPGLNNNLICNAVNLGTLNSGGSVGNAGLSNYGNFCANNAGDPNPWGGNNNQGVWFRFTTGSNPSTVINFDANSDPQGLGNPIDLQLALYRSSNGACNGALTLVQDEYQGLGFFDDEDMDVNCLAPNTTYFLLVDGERTAVFNPDGQEGFFGIQINDGGIRQAGDVICNAENLGTVPAGGSVGTPNLSRSNICAGNAGDPTPGAWAPDQTVWFMFQAPPSGHVFIDADSDLPWPIGTDAVDLQLAVYSTSNNLCTGVKNHIYSDYTPGLFDEDMDVRCLVPGQNYWVMVDGSGLNVAGIFDITISDGGQYPAPHDLICNALPLGQPAPGGTVGRIGDYNYCANNLFEPIPNNWGNDQGVWYTFIAPPSGKVEVRLNDYGLLGVDRIDLQVAVYDLSGMVCTGVPTELASEHDGIGVIWDEDMWVDCLIPGRTYWILVDGEGSIIDPDLREGIFDIEVYGDPQDPSGVNDEACNAIALGNPTGGAVSTTPGAHGSQNNFCADAVGEPQPTNWTADQTVWYTFVAPATGAINLQLNSDNVITGTDAINLQFALYETPGCAGPWQEITSGSGLIYDVDVDIWCLNAGQTYYLQVDGAPPVLLNGHEGYFDVVITEIPPIPVAANDTICGAIALGNPWAAPININGQHNLCANDWGDPTPSAFGTDQTVWYTFTTPATGGPFALDIQATSDLPWPFGVDAVDLQLAVFESSNNLCTGTLSEMTSEYSLLDFFNEFMNVRCLEEGKTYFLMVDGSFINVQGYFRLNLTPATPVPIPTNDLICSNINLGVVPVGGSINNLVNYSNFCSDVEPGEPNPFIDAIEQTVWFAFTAPNHVGLNATSNVTINATSDPGGLGDLVDLQLAVYESSNGLCSGSMSLVEDGSSEPAFSFDGSVNVTCLYPGQTYYIQIDGSILNQEGYFRLEIIDDGAGVRPTYNMLCNAINLGAVPNGGAINNGVNYTNLCSDTEPGEPVPNAFGIDKTVWFTFVAPASGNVIIDALSDPNAIGDAVDLQLAVYYSSNNLCTGSFLEVDSDYDVFNKDETLNVDCLEPGRIYFLQVDGAGGLLGDEDGWFTLSITDDGGTSNFPYNNDICNAYNFGTPTGTVQSRLSESNVCANLELLEPGVGGFATHTVWYQFTAPPSGRVEINVTSTNVILGMDPEVRVYSSSNNTCTGTLTQRESSFWPTALITENIEATCLVPGDTYFIQVDGQLLVTEGTFDIDIVDMIPLYVPPTNNGCDNAIDLAVQSESCLNGSGTFQTLNYGSPTITYNSAFTQGCGGNCGDTWYSFTMPFTGNAIIEGNDELGTFGSTNSDLTVVAYTGSCGSLVPLDCDQGGFSNDVGLNVSAPPGSTVWVQVFDDGGDDVNENYEICVSIGCGFDDCLASIAVPILPNIPYCFNTSSAEPDNVSGGGAGYYECSENDDAEHSIYYYFETDCNGADVTLQIMNGQINGSCILGVTPTDGFNISLFQDATPCDNMPDALVDCQTFTACDVQPVNWSFTYTGLTPNTPYIIQIDGGFGSFGGNNTGEIMITTTTSALLTPVSTPLTCSNQNDGTASAVTAGGAHPFVYNWSNGGTDSTITNLSAGMYYVTITGTNGCEDVDSVEVVDGIIINAATLPSLATSCNAVCDGQGTIVGVGGTITTGYTYLWDVAASSQTTATATGLCAGTYSVSVFDNGGCYDSTLVVVAEPAVLNIALSNAIASGCDSLVCVGTATSVVTGGTGAYTYLWSNGNTNAVPLNLCPGFNAVTVTDARGCSDSTSVIITAPIASTPPIITPIAGSFCPNTTVTLNATGGTAGAGSSINWYTGPAGTGTWLGNTNSIDITTSTTATYYVRREGLCNNTVDSSITVNVKYYVYAPNGTSTNTYCTDNAGWHHFYVGEEIILSIEGDITTGAMPGYPMVTIWDSTGYYQESAGPFTSASCINGWTPGEERFEMERSWNVDLGGGAVNAPYNVRFYYEPAERAAIEAAAAAHIIAYPACGYSYKYPYILGFYWFKNTSGNYDAALYDDLHLFGPLGSTINSVNYVELSAITSFSGGSGAIILIPDVLLPTDWLYFDGTTDNKTNYLTWGTEKEDNTSHFNVERSRDGINFSKLGEVAAQGHSNQTHHYTFDDVHPFEGANYYRLELIGTDGLATYSNTLMLSIAKSQLAYKFFPNPTDGYLYYQYQAEEEEELEVKVIDVLGKLLHVKTHTSVLGINNLPTDLNDYPAGTYMVRVHHKKTGYVHIAKVIKNKK